MALFVLGIDAAWTAQQPSGVALVRVRRRVKPRLLAVARSDEEFLSIEKLGSPAWRTRVYGTPPDIESLLRACERMAGHFPNLIALDIPLSNRPFAGRRFCDNLNKLRRALAHEIEGVDRIIPSAHRILQLGQRRLLKNLEDALDALVCAWTGIQILRGRAVAYGDDAGAIWVPKP